jgi:hypothetical protein
MSVDPAQFVVITNAFVNPPGSDVAEHNGEYLVVQNVGDTSVDVGGWTLRDAAGATVEIDAGYQIPSNGSLRLYTGPGVNASDRFYGGRRRAMLNNPGDTVMLFDSEGNLRQTFSY